MTTFKLDTSGAIDWVPHPYPGCNGKTRWPDLSPFVQGYVEAALTELTRTVTWLTEHTFEEPAFHMLAPETLARIMENCERFGAMCEANLWLIRGNEFWIMRQRGDLADKGFPSLTLYLSDDGKVRFRA